MLSKAIKQAPHMRANVLTNEWYFVHFVIIHKFHSCGKIWERHVAHRLRFSRNTSFSYFVKHISVTKSHICVQSNATVVFVEKKC